MERQASEEAPAINEAAKDGGNEKVEPWPSTEATNRLLYRGQDMEQALEPL